MVIVMIIYDFATPYSYYPPLFLSCLPPSPFLSFSFLSLSLFSRSLSSPVLSSRLFLFASAFGSSSSIRPLLTLFLPSVTNCCCIIGVFPVVVLTYPHRAKYNLGSIPAREPEKRLPHLRKAPSKITPRFLRVTSHSFSLFSVLSGGLFLCYQCNHHRHLPASHLLRSNTKCLHFSKFE